YRHRRLSQSSSASRRTASLAGFLLLSQSGELGPTCSATACFSIASQGRSEAQQLTSDDKYMSYEASMSPDGQSVVYESHVVNEEGNGRLRLLRLGASEPKELTDADEDCRQPNWSPRPPGTSSCIRRNTAINGISGFMIFPRRSIAS